MADRLLTAGEVADQLGISAKTVLRWVRRGELPAIRLPSGAIRFREREVEAWLAERATPRRGSANHHVGTPPRCQRYPQWREPPLRTRRTKCHGSPPAASFGPPTVTDPLARERPTPATPASTKTEARRWFADNIAPRLGRGAPSPRSPSTGSATCSSTATAPPSPSAPGDARRAARPTRERSAPGRCASSRAPPPTSPPGVPGSTTAPRYRLTSALRQTLAAAVRWRYIAPQPGRRRGQEPPAAHGGVPAVHPRRRSTRSPSSSAPSTGRSPCSPPRPACGPTSGSRPSAATSTGPDAAVMVQRRVRRRRAHRLPEDGSGRGGGCR